MYDEFHGKGPIERELSRRGMGEFEQAMRSRAGDFGSPLEGFSEFNRLVDGAYPRRVDPREYEDRFAGPPRLEYYPPEPSAHERLVQDAYDKGYDPRELSDAHVGPPQYRPFGMTRDEFRRDIHDLPPAYKGISPAKEERWANMVGQPQDDRDRFEDIERMSLEDIRARNSRRTRPSFRDRFRRGR